jgi:hypothetical protein
MTFSNARSRASGLSSTSRERATWTKRWYSAGSSIGLGCWGFRVMKGR